MGLQGVYSQIEIHWCKLEQCPFCPRVLNAGDKVTQFMIWFQYPAVASWESQVFVELGAEH